MIWEDNLQNPKDYKNNDNPNNKDEPKTEGNSKNDDYLKNEDDPRNEYNLKIHYFPLTNKFQSNNSVEILLDGVPSTQ